MQLPTVVICLLGIFLLPSFISSSKRITFKANAGFRRPLTDVTSFRQWMERPSTVLEILSMNPGLVQVEELAPGRYRGHVTPLEFPGVTITSVIDFLVKHDSNTLDMECVDDAIKMTYSGSEVLANIIRAIVPIVSSHSTIRIDDETGDLVNDAALMIGFDLPNFFPLPKSRVESSGSTVIQKNLADDLQTLSENIMKAYAQQQVELPI